MIYHSAFFMLGDEPYRVSS